MYFIYELWNPLKNEPFYVGYSKKINRPLDHINEAINAKKGEKHNWHKINTIKKIMSMEKEVEIKIVYYAFYIEDIKNAEKEIIKYWGRANLGNGPLTNLTNGGDGGKNVIYTKERRNEISKRISGSGNPMFNKTHTKMARNKMSFYQKFLRDPKTRLHSVEHKNSLKIKNPGGIATSKPVLQFDWEGNFINSWKSASEAGRKLSLGKGHISKSCDIPHKLYAKCFWRRPNDKNIINNKIQNITEIQKLYIKNKQKARNIKKIGKYEGDLLIKEFDSIKDAVKETKLKYCTFWLYMHKEKLINGFLYKYI